MGEEIKEKTESKEFDLDGVKLFAKNDEDFQKAKLKLESMRSGFNDLKAAKEKETNSKADSDRRAAALEAANKGLWEEAEQKFSAKYVEQIKERDDKLTKFQTKFIDGEIKSLLSQRTDIVPSAHEIILKTIKMDNKFDFDSDVLKANGKPAKEIVDDFLKDKDYWKLHKGPIGSGAGLKSHQLNGSEKASINKASSDQMAMVEAFRKLKEK